MPFDQSITGPIEVGIPGFDLDIQSQTVVVYLEEFVSAGLGIKEIRPIVFLKAFAAHKVKQGKKS